MMDRTGGSSRSQFLRRVGERVGLSEGESERVVRAVLSVVLEQLDAHDRAWLLGALPKGLAELPAGRDIHSTDDLESFHARVGTREGVGLSAACEHAVSVCDVIAETLRDDERVTLVHRLPDALGPLFERREAPQVPPHVPLPREALKAGTLAQGRAGSRHPLSESATPSGHQDSVARSDEPHADSKISSSHGMTSGFEAETLAAGRPGSKRPLSGGS